MKTVSAGLATHKAQRATTLATCWKVKRTDGVILGFTEHDKPLQVDLSDGDGTITYQAAAGYTRSAIKSSSAFNVDNLEVQGVLDSDAITAADLRAGRYDFAEIKIFMVNWKKTSDGVIALPRGTIGQTRLRGPGFFAELRGLMDRYTQEVVDVVQRRCRADLGDTASDSKWKCPVRVDPPEWLPFTPYTVRPPRDAGLGSVVKPSVFNDRHFKCVTAGTSGSGEPLWNLTIGGQTSDGSVVWETIQALTIETTVSFVTDNRTFGLAYTGDASEALLTRGLLTFVDTVSPSPLNVSLNEEVTQYAVSPPTITLFAPMPFDVAAGDPVTISAGCIKSKPVCIDPFDNVLNFHGEDPPGNDLFFRTRDAQ